MENCKEKKIEEYVRSIPDFPEESIHCLPERKHNMENCKEKKIEEYVRSIPDFPEEGVIFRDVTSILQDADGFALAVDSMQKLLEDSKVDVIVGTESRGFIFGAPIAYNLHKPLVLVRKKGKLPCETIEQSYELEYGSAVVEMHKDSIKPGQKVAIVDDLIGRERLSKYNVASVIRYEGK